MENLKIKPIIGNQKSILLTVSILTLIILNACTTVKITPLPAVQAAATTQVNPAPNQIPLPTAGTISTPCALPTIIAPTLPAVTPGYTQKDPATGLHVTGKAQIIDLASYRLEITGKINHPLSLSYDDLRCMPKITSTQNLVCPGFFEDVATWAGVPLSYILEKAGVQNGAEMLLLTSADKYSVMIPIKNALASENMLAYEWDGQPLPILHGFPVRAIFPGMAGGKWVKWLVAIDIY